MSVHPARAAADRPAVIVAGDDLLFSAQIAARLDTLGYRPLSVQTEAAFHDALETAPVAAILNLASRRLDAVAAIRHAKKHAATRGIPLLGFCGHADTARQDAARAAGCELVATNGEVTRDLQRLLLMLLPISGTPAFGR